MTNVSLGSRLRSIALAWSSTAAGQGESHERASMKNLAIADRAAVWTPLPATSPTRTATSPEGVCQTP